MKPALAVLVLAGCSVPALSLEGKQCPCVEAGYVCDEQTNRCLATNDGGGIIDTPSATQCLAVGNEMELYRYTGMFDWSTADGTWMGGAEIAQTSTNTQNAYAYKVNSDLTAAKDFRVISSMRTVQNGSGEPSLGIVLRAQLDTQNKSRYTCSWVGKARELRIDAFDGGNAITIGTAVVGANVTIPTTFTMEASVVGSTLQCCIREIGPARLTGVMSTLVTAGYPGLTTNRQHAAFGSFVVLKPI